jgi:hypothetical protein
MHDGREHVLFGSEAQKLGSKQRSAGEIEGPFNLFEHARFGKPFPFGAGKAGQIFYSQRPSIDRFDALNRLAAVNREGRSQRVVSTDNFVERAFECEHIERTVQLQDEWHVVERRARRELVEKPQALLCK